MSDSENKRYVEFRYTFDSFKSYYDTEDYNWMSKDEIARAKTVGLSMLAKDPKDLHKKMHAYIALASRALGIVNGVIKPNDSEKKSIRFYSNNSVKEDPKYENYLSALSDVAHFGADYSCYGNCRGPILIDHESEYYKTAVSDDYRYGTHKTEKETEETIHSREKASVMIGQEYDDLNNTITAVILNPKKPEYGFYGEERPVQSIYGKMIVVVVSAYALGKINGDTGLFKKYSKLCEDYCKEADLPTLIVPQKALDAFFTFVTDESSSAFKIDPSKLILAIESGNITFWQAITSIEITATSEAEAPIDRFDYLKNQASFWSK